MTQTQNSFFMKFLIRFLFKKASIFLCQGEKWQNYAIDFIGFDESNIRIINNWTATKELILIGSNRNYEINRTVKQLLFIGWLEEFDQAGNGRADTGASKHEGPQQTQARPEHSQARASRDPSRRRQGQAGTETHRNTETTGVEP